MMKQSLALLAILFVFGCATHNELPSEPNLPRMQQLAQCMVNIETQEFEKEILAERGFRRVTDNAFSPVVGETLFGHEVRIINLEVSSNRIYVAGRALEFGHHFKSILPQISCDNKSCQAAISDTQTLHIYNAKVKKSKDTAVIECIKPELATPD